MFRLLLYIIGVIFTSIGLFFIIIYLNLLTIGYSFIEFVQFISRRVEVWLFVIGIALIGISLERWIKNELLLRHNFKLGRK
mgnify:FL=1